jgi:hypothetical protein
MTIRTFLAKGDWAGQAEIIEGLSTSTYQEEDGRVVDLATVYMKTYCHACKKAGHISPAGYRLPSIAENGQEFALSGDINICDCNPAPVFHAIRNMTATITSEDIAQMRAAYAPAYVPQGGRAHEEYAHEKVSTEKPGNLVDHPELICSNMSNAEFFALMDGLRDKAVRLLTDRLNELARWNRTDQDKVGIWFGSTETTTRYLLIEGLTRMREIAKGLTSRNYEKQTPENLARAGCIPRSGENIAAASVCKPNGAYTIFIGATFCTMEVEKNRFDGVPLDGDSKLLTLIHEISHFPVTMDSEDHWYTTRISREHAADRDAFCLSNADNIAGYVINMPKWNSRGDAEWR